MRAVPDQSKYERLKELFPELTPLQAPLDLTVEEQLGMYRTMVKIRKFDTAVKDLWKKNIIYGIAHSYVGAEAVAVGACAALRESDRITSTHRGHGHVIAKGGDMKLMMAELMGKATGYCGGKGGSMHIAAVNKGMLGATGIVGSGMPIAVGSGLSAQVLNTGDVTLCFHGDGATNQGVWHESVNLCAAWRLPVVFVCENNQYAISFPFDRASGNPDIAQRALGYGIPGVTVDGFNAFAVYGATERAVERARAGKGPTLVVAKFFRYVGHFVADDQSYRDMDAVEPWLELDPVSRMRDYLLEAETASDGEVDAIETDVERELEAAIEFGMESPEPKADELFKDLYAPGTIITQVGGEPRWTA
jgi:pyruvate dehydrogenase E1 component alpha subunit